MIKVSIVSRFWILVMLVQLIHGQSLDEIKRIKQQIKQQWGDDDDKFEGIVSKIVQNDSATYFVKYRPQRIYRVEVSDSNVNVVINSQGQMQFFVPSQLPFQYLQKRDSIVKHGQGIRNVANNMRNGQRVRASRMDAVQTLEQEVDQTKQKRQIKDFANQQERVKLSKQRLYDYFKQYQKNNQLDTSNPDYQQIQQTIDQQISQSHQEFQMLDQQMAESDQRLQKIHEQMKLMKSRKVDMHQRSEVEIQLVQEHAKRVYIQNLKRDLQKQQRKTNLYKQRLDDYVEEQQKRNNEIDMVDLNQLQIKQMLDEQMAESDERLQKILEQRKSRSIDMDQRSELEIQLVSEHAKRVQIQNLKRDLKIVNSQQMNGIDYEQIKQILDEYMDKSDEKLQQIHEQRNEQNVDMNQKLKREMQLVSEHTKRIQIQNLKRDLENSMRLQYTNTVDQINQRVVRNLMDLVNTDS